MAMVELILWMTSLDADAELWMNRSPIAGHWLDFALSGVKSNRDGIGARIKVVTNGRHEWSSRMPERS